MVLLFFASWFLHSCLCSLVLSADGTSRKLASKLFKGEVHSKGSYRLIADSNVCETTPGVHTYSGYIDVGHNQSMFFWFFEARNNPKNAPFTLWLNGGPGCSSLIGAFQENGPCKVEAEGTSTTLNPYSWNKYANMIYLDQPIPAGFSYGSHDVYSTKQAAARVWDFFQILFGIPHFTQYESRELSVWAESYGGQYGPKFLEYFKSQNEKIKADQLKGHIIDPASLGITNGWFNPYYHYSSYYDYAQAKYNHVADIAKPEVLADIKFALYSKGGCLSQIKQCESSGNNTICHNADIFCNRFVLTPAIGIRNPYFFEHDNKDPFPSEVYLRYLSLPKVTSAIGAESKFSECPDTTTTDFSTTGDGARSSTSALAKLLNQGLRTVIWAGDRDFICNTLGGYQSIQAMDWDHADEFRQAAWRRLVFRGKNVGTYKTAGSLTYITIHGAGHEIPAYKPEVALEVFRQTVSHERIHSVAR